MNYNDEQTEYDVKIEKAIAQSKKLRQQAKEKEEENKKYQERFGKLEENINKRLSSNEISKIENGYVLPNGAKIQLVTDSSVAVVESPVKPVMNELQYMRHVQSKMINDEEYVYEENSSLLAKIFKKII